VRTAVALAAPNNAFDNGQPHVPTLTLPTPWGVIDSPDESREEVARASTLPPSVYNERPRSWRGRRTPASFARPGSASRISDLPRVAYFKRRRSSTRDPLLTHAQTHAAGLLQRCAGTAPPRSSQSRGNSHRFSAATRLGVRLDGRLRTAPRDGRTETFDKGGLWPRDPSASPRSARSSSPTSTPTPRRSPTGSAPSRRDQGLRVMTLSTMRSVERRDYTIASTGRCTSTTTGGLPPCTIAHPGLFNGLDTTTTGSRRFATTPHNAAPFAISILARWPSRPRR